MTKQCIIGILAMLAMAGTVNAHQQKESYTTILVNTRSGQLEISHRFYIHDAEHAIVKVTGKNADLTRSEDAKVDFATYIRNTFQLKGEQGELIVLTVVGQEAEGKYFWVYQEAPLPKNLNQFSVKMTSLQEVWPSQVNQVNFERGKEVRAVRLTSDDSWEEFPLAK